MYFNTEINILD